MAINKSPCCGTSCRYISGTQDTFICDKCGSAFTDLHNPAKRAAIPQSFLPSPPARWHMRPSNNKIEIPQHLFGHFNPHDLSCFAITDGIAYSLQFIIPGTLRPNTLITKIPVYFTVDYDIARGYLIISLGPIPKDDYEVELSYKGVPLDGRYWQASQGAPGNPPQGTFSSPAQGGAAGVPGPQQAAQQAALQAAAGSLAQQLRLLVPLRWNSYTDPFEEPPPKLENAGITLGEIIGWRCWRLTKTNFLQSGYKDTIWLPGEPMTGKPKQVHEGVYAFKKEASMQLHRAVDEYARGGNGQVAWGTVSMWGTVVEHETGYRAEFARVKSIEALGGVPYEEYQVRLAILREQYCK